MNLQNFHDADQRIYIAEGKFRKARWVPVSASTCRVLQQYITRRLRFSPRSSDAPLFLNQRTCRLHHGMVHQVFRTMKREMLQKARAPTVNKTLPWQKPDVLQWLNRLAKTT